MNFIFLSLLLFLPLVFSGQIHPFELYYDYTNYNLIHEVSFKFMLDTPLSKDSYLRIKFPFSIDNSGLGMLAYWSDFPNVSFCQLNNFYYLTRIEKSVLSIDLSENVYLIQFFSENYDKTDIPIKQVSLNSNQWYFLKIKFGKTILAPSLELPLNPLELYTIASKTTDFIIQDYNRNFAPIQLSPIPTSLYAYSAGIANGFVNTINQASFWFQPSVSIRNQARINLVFSNEKYVFTNINQCQVLYYQSDSSNLISIGKDLNCELETQYSMMLNLETGINNLYTYQIIINFRFPIALELSSLSIVTMYRYSRTALEAGTLTNYFVPKPIEWDAAKTTMKLGWGIDFKTITTANSVFRLYRNGLALIKTYNNIRILFSPKIGVSNIYKLKMTLELDSTAVYLPNSFTHNFDAFSSLSITCTFTSLIITCINIGGISNTTTYTIGLRVSIANDGTNTASLSEGFFKISMFPYYKDSILSSSITNLFFFPATLYTIPIANNIDKIPINALVGHQGVHSKRTGTLINTDGYGVKYRTDNLEQDLEFTLNNAISDFSASPLGTSAGLDIYTSDVINLKSGKIYSNTDCYASNALYSSSKIGVCTIKSSTISNVQTTLLQIGYNDAALANAAWGTINDKFGFKSLVVSKHNSFYPEGIMLDFYMGTIGLGFQVKTIGDFQIYYKRYLINSFTVSPSNTLSNVNAYLTHFWSAAANGLDGEHFPAFIRLWGTLNLDESAAVSKFFILTDLVSGYSDPDGTTKTIPNCGTNFDGYCSFRQGETSSYNFYIWYNKFEVVLKTLIQENQLFQIVLPINTLQNTIGSNIYLITLDSNNRVLSTKSLLISPTPPGGSTTWQGINDTPSPYAGIIGANYGLANKGQSKVGETGTATISIYHTDSTASAIFNKNVNPNYGAAFCYVTKYSFYDGVNTPEASSNLNGTLANERCTTFRYYYSVSKEWRYVIYCPIYNNLGISTFLSNVTIKNFKFPSSKGATLPDGTLSSYGAISTKSGLLIHYEIDNQEDFLIPNLLIIPSNPMTFSLILNRRDLGVGIYFNNANPLPSSHRIILYTADRSELFSFSVVDKTPCKLSYKNIDNVIPAYICKQRYFLNRLEAIITIIDGTTILPPDQYIIYFQGIDVYSGSIAYQNVICETLDISGNLIDRSSIFKISYLKLDDLKLEITNITLNHYNKLSRSTLNISFISKARPLFNFETLRFSLEPFSQDNTETGDLHWCHIRFQNNNTVSNHFESCTFNNYFYEILIPLKLDLDADIPLNLILTNVRVPAKDSSSNCSLSVLNYENLQILNSENFVLQRFKEKKDISEPSIMILKQYNVMGSIGGVIFTLFSRKINIDSKSVIYINFPAYYSPKFSDHSRIAVFINNDYINHVYISDHQIKIMDFNVNISYFQFFTIQVVGFDIPYYSKADSFFIGLDNDNDGSDLIEYGEILDIINDKTVPLYNLLISNITYTNKEVFQFSDYEIEFWNPIEIISNFYVLIVDFSVDWGEQTFRFIPNCFIKSTKEGSASITQTNCQFQGLKLVVNLTKNYEANQYMVLKIGNFKNPENPSCEIRKFIVLITSNTTSNVLYRSNSAHTNINRVSFFSNFQFKNWIFEKNGTKINKIQLIRGSYSEELTLKVEDKTRVNQNIKINILNFYKEKFLLAPNTPMVEIGFNGQNFRIGTPIDTQIDLYYIFFQIEQSYLMYNYPPTLLIEVISGFISISEINLNYFLVPQYGISLPLTIKIKNPPFEGGNIISMIDLYPDLGIDYKKSNILMFNGINAEQTLVFKSLYYIDSPTKKSFFNLVIDALNPLFFQWNIDNRIPIQLGDVINYKPLVTLTMGNISYSYLDFVINSTDYIYIYYHIRYYKSKIIRSFKNLDDLLREEIFYDPFDENEEQIRAFGYNRLKTNMRINITNLKSAKIYNLTILCSDLNGNFMVLLDNQFATKIKNDTYKIRAKVTFDKSINSFQLKMISCYFISYFSLRYYQVFSVENYFCDQFNPYINTGIPLEDNSSNDSKVLNFHDSNNISNTSYTTYFYFLPFDFIETSDNTSNVIWSSLSQSGDSGSSIIATQMNQNIPFKRFNFETKFISILTDAKIVINDPQNILSNQTIVFPYNFTLELGLQENGFVWLVLEKINTVDKNKKNVINILKTSEYLSKWQIIRGFNRTNQTAVSLNFQLSTNRYKNISISAFNLEPETNYGYFFMASNEETGNQRKYTDVYWNYFTTPAAFIEKLKISIILILICYFLY